MRRSERLHPEAEFVTGEGSGARQEVADAPAVGVGVTVPLAQPEVVGVPAVSPVVLTPGDSSTTGGVTGEMVSLFRGMLDA